MFTSRTTVKTHLEHIYAKLGIRSRTELAAAATRNTIPDDAAPATPTSPQRTTS